MANEVVKFKLNGVTEALSNQHVIVLDTDSSDTVLMNNRTLDSDISGNVELDVSSTGKSNGDKVRIFGDDYPLNGDGQKGFNYVGTVEGGVPLIRILLIGDSTTYGKGASSADSSGVTGAHINSPCRQLADHMVNLGVVAESRSVVGMGNNSESESTELYFNATPDVSVTLNGWYQLPFDSIGGNLYESDSTGRVLTFEFDGVNRGAIGLPIRAYGEIRYRIDGGVWITVSGTGDIDLMRIDLDFGLVGYHTVEFEYVSGAPVFVSYCEAWNTASQLVIVPWGARGYTSTQLNDSERAWSYKSALSLVPFDAVLINIGINDVSSGATSEVNYVANVTAYINAVKAANPDAKIFINIPNDISVGLSYLPTAIADLAASESVTLLDARDAVEMSDYATANASGHMFDTLHPSETGYSNIYEYYAPLIKSGLGI